MSLSLAVHEAQRSRKPRSVPVNEINDGAVFELLAWSPMQLWEFVTHRGGCVICSLGIPGTDRTCPACGGSQPFFFARQNRLDVLTALVVGWLGVYLCEAGEPVVELPFSPEGIEDLADSEHGLMVIGKALELAQGKAFTPPPAPDSAATPTGNEG